MKIINLTPHTLNIHTTKIGIIEVPASGQTARLQESREVLQAIDGIEVTRAAYGNLKGLPEPAENTIYVVSGLALQAVVGREDVFAPGPAVRDEDGRIIGCDGLSAPAPQEVRAAGIAALVRECLYAPTPPDGEGE